MGINYGTSIVRDGLVLYLDAANTKSYPGTGTTWFDLSPSQNHAIGTSMPTFTTGINGHNCFDFANASSHYFQTTSNSSFSGSNFPITVSAVISERSTRAFATVLGQSHTTTAQAMAFMSYNGVFGTDHWQPGGRKLAATPTLGQIYYVTWVQPNWTTHMTTGEIYLNGELQSTISTGAGVTGSLLADKFIIGNWLESRTDMDWDGQIYSVQVHNRALTAAEIKQNFDALRGRYGL